MTACYRLARGGKKRNGWIHYFLPSDSCLAPWALARYNRARLIYGFKTIFRYFILLSQVNDKMVVRQVAGHHSLSNRGGTAEYRPICQQTFPLQDGSGFTTEGTASLSQVKAVTAAPEKATAFPVAGTATRGTPQTPPPAED